MFLMTEDRAAGMPSRQGGFGVSAVRRFELQAGHLEKVTALLFGLLSRKRLLNFRQQALLGKGLSEQGLGAKTPRDVEVE